MPHKTHTEDGYELSPEKTLRAPLRLWVSLIAAVALAATAWAYTTGNVANNSKRIDNVEAEQRELANEVRMSRLMLERVDANVSAIKEAQARRAQ